MGANKVPIIFCPYTVLTYPMPIEESSFMKTNGIMTSIFSVIGWVFFVGPFAEKKPFGEHSYTISATFFWIGWVLSQICNCMGYLSDTVSPEVSKVWNTKITEYMEGIVRTLLDVETGKSATMERLAHAQSEAELFARNMNTVFSTTNGITNLIMIMWIFVMIALLAFPSNSSSSSTRAVQIGLLSFMVLIFSVFSCLLLLAITSQILAFVTSHPHQFVILLTGA